MHERYSVVTGPTGEVVRGQSDNHVSVGTLSLAFWSYVDAVALVVLSAAISVVSGTILEERKMRRGA